MNDSFSPKAIIFDIDGTLAPTVSWLDLTRDLGASVDTHRQIFAEYLCCTIDYPESKRQLLSLWQATGHADRDFIASLFSRWPLHSAAERLIQAYREQGLAICLITGSFDLYAHIIATRLSVTDWYANTPLVFEASGQLADYHYHRDQAAKKLEHLHQFCARHHLKPTDCLAVGDSDNDLELFRATGHGILIKTRASSPDQSSKLRQSAWRTIGSLSELDSFN